MFNVRRLAALTLLLGVAQSVAACQNCVAAPRRVGSSGFAFSPKVLNFGRVPWGQISTQVLTLTLDNRHFNVDHLPTWTDDFGGNVSITQFSRHDHGGHTILQYLVTLPDVPGKYEGEIRLTTRFAWDVPANLRNRALENQGVLLTGEVVPGVAVSPPVVDFGRVSQGKEATAYFTLALPVDNWIPLRTEQNKPFIPAGYGLGSVRDLHFVSDSRDVSARWVFGMGSMDRSGWTYEVKLGMVAPSGSFRHNLTCTTASGQVLVVPVYAQVIASTESKK